MLENPPYRCGLYVDHASPLDSVVPPGHQTVIKCLSKSLARVKSMYRRIRAYPCSEKDEGKDQKYNGPRPGINRYHLVGLVDAVNEAA